MNLLLFVAMILSITAVPGMSLAQMSPDIASGIRKIGPIVDVPNTARLYAPLFEQQKEPYPGVTVARDLSYGPEPLNRIDVFTSGPSTQANKTVVMYVHGGGFERGDKRPPGSPFYDNIMLWATRQGMVGVNVDYRLAPKAVWWAAHDDLAAAVRWVRSNIARYGGDPNRIVLWGQSSGAGLIAGYLAWPRFHASGDDGVRAAVLNSGTYENDDAAYFGTDPNLKERSSVEGMKHLTIPLFLSDTEVDLPAAIAQADAANKALCDAGHCPTYVMFQNHSHMSQNYSVGTADISVSGPMLQFIQGIK